MAAITKQSLLRPIIRHHNNLSSFSSNPHPINSTNPNPNSNSLIDVKATLKKQPSPSSFLQDIRRNLTDYRSPSSSSGNYVSFKDLLKTNVLPKINDPSTSRIRYTNQTGSTFNLFKNEKNNNNMSLLLMSHEYTELGKKLGKLRPERRKMDWFSLQELSDRMAKLKEIEDDERRNKLGGFIGFKELNDSFTKLRDSEAERVKAKTVLRLDVLRSIGGGTPSFMQDPPKEDLLEQYFHPDNMSSAEKLKLELKNVRDQFKMSESDCGSARVQVAQLTTKIKHLSTVLAKKDKHSRKGLQAMVQKRKKLLKYLRRTDWDSYSLVLSKLGLRDNPDIKA